MSEASFSFGMSTAISPSTPSVQFTALDRPFGLWIGSEDELFQPDKVLAYAELARAVRDDSQARIIPGAKHLSVLIRAHEVLGPWIQSKID